jgi:lysophosphatidate acyltransferase
MPLSWVLKPLAIASAVAFGALGILSRKYQKARLYFNVTIYLTTLATTSVWGILVTILASATGQVRDIHAAN